LTNYQSGDTILVMGTRSNDPFYQELGKELKKARVAADKTPTQVANVLGHSHSVNVGRYENASRIPDVKTFFTLANEYGVEPQSIVANAISAAAQINQQKGNDGKRQKEK
jgi:hypothetical protein